MADGGRTSESPPRRRRRAVFIDRDGTLNPDLKYLAEAERLELFGGVAQGLRWLRSHGYLAVCVTNQSGIERGFYTAEDVERIHQRVNERLRSAGTEIDAFYYCPHAPETRCACRKPGVDLFLRAQRDLSIDFAASAIIGDRALDVEAGERLGLLTAVVMSPGHVAEVEAELAARGATPDLRSLTFPGAARRILARG